MGLAENMQPIHASILFFGQMKKWTKCSNVPKAVVVVQYWSKIIAVDRFSVEKGEFSRNEL
jgi:hypothetical protein